MWAEGRILSPAASAAPSGLLCRLRRWQTLGVDMPPGEGRVIACRLPLRLGPCPAAGVSRHAPDLSAKAARPSSPSPSTGNASHSDKPKISVNNETPWAAAQPARPGRRQLRRAAPTRRDRLQSIAARDVQHHDASAGYSFHCGQQRTTTRRLPSGSASPHPLRQTTIGPRQRDRLARRCRAQTETRNPTAMGRDRHSSSRAVIGPERLVPTSKVEVAVNNLFHQQLPRCKGIFTGATAGRAGRRRHWPVCALLALI